MKKRRGIVGTPSQITTIGPKNGDKRRNRDCFYYQQNGRCSLISKCCGATQCPNYMEHRKANASLANYKASYKTSHTAPKNTASLHKSISQKTPTVKKHTHEEIKKVGCRVYHKGSLSSCDGGAGTVIAANGQKITVEFDSGRREVFLLPWAIQFLNLLEQ